MGNLIASIFIWVWSNFIGWPREESRFIGFIRVFIYFYFMLENKALYNLFDNEIYQALIPWFCLIQIIIGVVQIAGGYSINGPFDFELNKAIKDGKRDGSITVISDRERTFEEEYPGLTWWFRVRENEMSGMSHSQKAKFFIETGGLTEASVKEMSKYKNTKRALQRLDFECKRPHKELVNYMRGVKIK